MGGVNWVGQLVKEVTEVTHLAYTKSLLGLVQAGPNWESSKTYSASCLRNHAWCGMTEVRFLAWPAVNITQMLRLDRICRRDGAGLRS